MADGTPVFPKRFRFPTRKDQSARHLNSNQQWGVTRFPDDRDCTDAAATDFLVTDLDLALTFMDIAETNNIGEVAHRNREKARQTYITVKDSLSKPALRHVDCGSVETRLARLKARLDSAGYGPPTDYRD
jgi:hypothetical protein